MTAKKEWGLTMEQSLIVEKACNSLGVKIETARNLGISTALVYKCPEGECKIIPHAAQGIVHKFKNDGGQTRTLAEALADQTNPVLTGTTYTVALNCVQKGHGDNLVVEFINWEPHLAIRL